MEFLTSLYRKIESIYPNLSLEDKKGYVLMRLSDEVQEQITTATRGTDDESGVEDSDTDLAENDYCSQEDDSQSIHMLESGKNNEKT